MLKYFLAYVFLLLLRAALNVLNVFSIKRNQIMFYSFNGKQYSCNPRRISESLQKRNGRKYRIIWAFKDPNSFRGSLPEGVTAVKYRSPRYYFLAKTSKVIVVNVQGYGELARRKGQTVIQTWHASNGYKKVGVHLKGVERKFNLLCHRDYSYVMCGSKNMEIHRIRGSMDFHGPIVQGTPRMDSMINMNLVGMREKVCAWLKIEPSRKILLYAPTWRKNRRETDYGMDYRLVKESMEKRFGGEWIIAVRLHPNVYRSINTELDYVRDATKYPDMEELVYVADAMVSDYSSCIWDYSFTYRPCFLLCTDLHEYDVSRSFDLPIESWGFDVCVSSEQLSEAILNFDAEKHRQSMIKHHEDMGSLEDGHATERICALIENAMDDNGEKA